MLLFCTTHDTYTTHELARLAIHTTHMLYDDDFTTTTNKHYIRQPQPQRTPHEPRRPAPCFLFFFFCIEASSKRSLSSPPVCPFLLYCPLILLSSFDIPFFLTPETKSMAHVEVLDVCEWKGGGGIYDLLVSLTTLFFILFSAGDCFYVIGRSHTNTHLKSQGTDDLATILPLAHDVTLILLCGFLISLKYERR